MRERFAIRLYRTLLRAYPGSFRARFADGMTATFAEDLRHHRGFITTASFLVLTIWQVVTGAVVEHVAVWKKRTAHGTGNGARQIRPTRKSVLDGFALDLRLVLRRIRLQPGSAAIIITTLGVGVAASTAIFSVVNTLALRPLPFEASDRLLRLRDTVDRPGEASWWYSSSSRSFVFVKENSSSFSSVTGGEYRRFNVTGLDEPVTIVGTAVSDAWLETLGVAPVLGRGFTVEEQGLGDAARSVLIGHGLWTRQFGRDDSVLGRSLILDGQSYTVIGVMPQGLNFPYGSELWVMGSSDPNEARSSRHVIARVATGVSLQMAMRELDQLSSAAKEAYPDTHSGIRFTAVGMREDLVGNRSDLGFVLLGAVGLLLLIACGNVANLLLVRATARRQDFALRTALGASRWRQVRQVLTESTLLAACGWVIGVVFAGFLTDAMASLAPPPSDSLGEFFADTRLDARVLLFSIVLTGVTATVTALLPALRAARADVRHAIAEGHALGGRMTQPWLRIIVVAEVAVAFVLLAGASTLWYGLRDLQQSELGFESTNRMVVSLAMSSFRYPEQEDRVQMVRSIEQVVAQVPGVRAVGLTQHTPVSIGDWTTQMTIEGGFASTAERSQLANFRTVTPGFFDAIGVTFVAGRPFTPEENNEERNVVIVTESMAMQHWARSDVVGRRVKMGPIDNDNPWLTVVGVARDVKEEWNGVDHTWYVPYRQAPLDVMNLVIQHDGPVETVFAAVRSAVGIVDPDQPLAGMRPLGELVDQSFNPERFGTLLVGTFAVFGLTLSALGIYGVLTFAVRQRTREIGLRIALGARATSVLRNVLASGIALSAIGVAVGLGAFRLISRLPRVEWADGDVNQFRLLAEGINLSLPGLAIVIAVLFAITMFASYLPARRAVRVSPVVALKQG